jgi:hypothetical protein
MLHFKLLEKQEQVKPKTSRRREMKIKGKINEIRYPTKHLHLPLFLLTHQSCHNFLKETIFWLCWFFLMYLSSLFHFPFPILILGIKGRMAIVWATSRMSRTLLKTASISHRAKPKYFIRAQFQKYYSVYYLLCLSCKFFTKEFGLAQGKDFVLFLILEGDI